MPTEKPILFSGPMVKAILEGRKTQTRRVVKPQPVLSPNRRYWHWPRLGGVTYWETGTEATRKWATERMYDCCPYGQPGDRLWVRETFWIFNKESDDPYIHYRATDAVVDPGPIWRPSIHMPRWASRLTLEITGVRVERVQDITPRDVVAEGLYHAPGEWGADQEYDHLVKGFAGLWNEINAKRGYGWDVNPWCWVVEFRRAP